MNTLLTITSLLVTLVALATAAAMSQTQRHSQSAEARPATPGRPQGALVPISAPRSLPDLRSIDLTPIAHGSRSQAALVIQSADQLSASLQLARVKGTLSTIQGPVASAVASLLNNPKIMDTVLGKAGLYLVKASPGAKWMTANGVKVAQEAGKAGQAGTRAVIIGGAAFALGPELIAVGLATYAEYVITVKIERVGKVAGLIHHRQVADVLSTADQVLYLIGRLREYDTPGDWPEVLVAPLVTAHIELSRQTFAAARLRELIMSGDPDGDRQPAEPAAGDRSSAYYELAAGYELLAVAAQGAAVRLVHALANGDEVTAAELELQLHHHIEQLREHHRAIDALTNRKSRWFKQGWGKALSGLRESHAEVIALVEAQEYEFVLAIEGPKVELLALPPASTDLPPPGEESTEQEPIG